MISVIDIGTNTILMVTGEVGGDGSVRIVGDEHEIARLGRGVDATRTIVPETVDRIAPYLVRYRQIAESLGAERIVAFGTSALRDARNRDEFILQIRRRVGIEIEVMSGEDEAHWTYIGALFNLGDLRGPTAVLDIGGGSTELALGDGVTVQRASSLDIGAVRLAERYLRTLPPSADQLVEAGCWCDESVMRLFDVPLTTTLVGVAGTVTTLGAIDARQDRFDAGQLNGHRLHIDAISSTIASLSSLTIEQTAAIPQISIGRADIILGGAMILRAAMQRLRQSEIVVSTRGVRYGVLLRELNQRIGI